MFQDDSRLTFSIQDKRVSIIDNMSNAMFVRNTGSVAECSNLKPEIVFSHIQEIQRSLAGKDLVWWAYRPFAKVKGDTTTISEFNNSIRFIVEGKCAELRDSRLFGELGFNVNKLLRDINFAYSLLYEESETLRPYKDVVRFYADSNIFVIRNFKHSIIVRSSNVSDGVMSNVMFDDTFYPTLTYNFDDSYCTISDTDGNVLLTLTTDFSVKTYLGIKKVTEEEEQWRDKF